MRDARGKVPDVAVANLGGLEDAVFVDGGNGDAAVVDDAPFSLAIINTLALWPYMHRMVEMDAYFEEKEKEKNILLCASEARGSRPCSGAAARR